MKQAFSVICSVVAFAISANGLLAVDGTWTAAGGSWTNTANWDGGIVADGGVATFRGPASNFQIDIPAGYPFTLSELIFNPTNAQSAVTFAGETNTLVAPARFEINRENAFFKGQLRGSAGLHFFGKSEHSLTLENTNFFTGTVTAENGRLLPKFDESLGAVPSALIPNAVVVSNATLGNYGNPGLEIHPNRGIKVVENAYFHGREGGGPGHMRIHSPVTGDGNVWILRQTGFMEFLNPANDYTGDTIFGSTKLGYNNTANATATLRLGADEVIPHGPGKGRLLFANVMDGTIDLQGHTETVNGIGSPDDGDFQIINSSAEPGLLKIGVDDSDSFANGTIGAGVTLEKIGTGALHFVNRSPADPQGTLKISGGSLVFTDPAHLGPLTLALNGGTLCHTNTQPGLAEYVGSISSGSIDFNAPLRFNGIRLSPRMGNRGINANFANNTQYQYLGQWYVPANGTYSFAQSFDDRAYLAIDGNPVLSEDIASPLIVKRDVDLQAGWHDIEIRLSQGTGNVGPRTNTMDTAIVYDPNNGDFSDFSNAHVFSDPGDGSVLRTLPLCTDTMTVSARAELLQDTVFDRSGTAAPLVWTGDLVTMAPSALRLTISGGPAEPFRFGSTDRHAVFFADVDTANGVIFQDNAWLLAAPTLPTTWSIAPGADIAIGASGILSGNQTLSDYSLRIPVAAPLGNGSDTITVAGSSKTLTFDATRVEDGRITDDPSYAFTAANDVVLSGTDARVAFDGVGTVNYTGEISGDGALVKNGTGTASLAAANTFTGDIIVNAGSLAVSDDTQLGDPANTVTLNGGHLALTAGGTFSRDITAAGGGIGVDKNAPLTLTGTLAGTLTKTGPGTLSIPGANSALDLYVTEGDVALASSTTPSVRHILGVDAGAALRIANGAGNQIAGNVTLTGGTFDLAGHGEAIGSLSSATPLSLITSTSPSATLTVGEGNANSVYVGGLSGDLALTKIGTGSLAVAGAPGTQISTGPVTVTGGDFALGLGVRQIRFIPTRTRTPDTAPTLSEFQITRNGKVIPWPIGTSTTGTSSTSSNQTWNVIDNNTRKAWQASAAHNQYFTIHMPEPVVFDGYRWYTGSTTAGSNAGDPVAWEIHVSTDNTIFILADTREITAATLSTARGVEAGTWALSQGPLAALAPAAVSVASGAAFRVQLANHAIGTLSGAGAFDIRPGTTLAVGDLSGFSGSIRGKDATLVLEDSTPLTLSSAAAGVTAVNGTQSPLTVSIGALGDGTFFGTLKDGPGAPLGLIKRGSGNVYLADAGSTYTGDTVIESGTLTVSGTPFNFRYVRFNVTAALDPGVDSAGYEMAYSEFQLLLNGQLVEWPAGTVANEGYVKGDKNHGDDVPFRAIDNNPDNRWLSQPLQPLVIDTKSGVHFDGYRYYVSKVNNQDRPRAPVAWTVDGSIDGVNWVTLDAQSGTAIPGYDTTVSVPPLIGPYELTGLSTLDTLPPALRAETPATSNFLTGVTAQYLRFTVTQVRRTGFASGDNTGFQFAELRLLKDGTVLQWPGNVVATAPGDQWPSLPACNPSKVVNNTFSDSTSNNDDRWLSDSMINPLTLTLPSPVTFDSYQWVTAHNTEHRDPRGWILEVSEDGNTWHTVDNRLNESVTTTRAAIIGPYQLVLPAGGPAVDMIPDASRVIVHADAALNAKGSIHEIIGPLSGEGTVAIDAGAVLGINLTEDAEFAGTLAGTDGTLALAGDHALRLTGAATTPSDFTVDFRGGRFSGLLRVGGALTVTGDVAYAMPETLPAIIPLFTFGSIDPASRDALTAGLSSLAVPKGYAANLRFTPTTATLTVTAPGMILLLQ